MYYLVLPINHNDSLQIKMLASQKLASLTLDLGPDLFEEFCKSLNSRPEFDDPEFVGAFPAPKLAHLELFTNPPSQMTGAAVLEILELRQSRLQALPDNHESKFVTLKLSEGLMSHVKAQDWQGLVDEKEGSVVIV